MEKKCDECGFLNRSAILKEGDACDDCCGSIFNKYGKFAKSESAE